MQSLISSTPLRQERPKLLVIDDQPLNIRIMNELLSGDFDIFMANSGLQGITKCLELSPDIVLLDVVMPGIDGYEVCKRLKLDPITSNIPIIFVTAHFDESEEVRGFELGAVDFIHKPINPVITKARIHNQLMRKQQQDFLNEIALMDGLTGIANRRKFDNELQSDWLQCSRDKQPLSLLIIDVDFFKLYNDRYGHLMGDECLKIISKTLKNSLHRPYDLVARYGGEEFACLLPRTPLAGALILAEKILSNIRNLNIEHKASTIDKFVTVSIGVACKTPNIEGSPERLVEAADNQLYISKELGRNRINSKAM